MPDKRIRVLLVDDHRIMREGLRLLIERQPGMAVVGEAANARDALEQALECSPDIVVMDVSLPDENGIEAARGILTRLPATRVIILSSHADPTYARQAIDIGVSGYVLKEDASEELIRGIRAILDGKLYLCPGMTTSVLLNREKPFVPEAASGRAVLTERETHLLRLIATGQRNKEIATELGVSVNSVESYRSRLMRKLGLQSTAELVRYAIREGIVMA